VPPARLTYKDSSFSQVESASHQCAKSLALERTVKQLKERLSKLEITVAKMERLQNAVYCLSAVKDEDLTWTPFLNGQPSSMENMDALLLLPTSQNSIPPFSRNSLASLSASDIDYRLLDLSPIRLNFEDGSPRSSTNYQENQTIDQSDSL
jgi:hypothetical protein